MSLLEVSDLRIDYITQAGDVSAVDGVSFRVDEDQIFGLAGESGSGSGNPWMACDQGQLFSFFLGVARRII